MANAKKPPRRRRGYLPTTPPDFVSFTLHALCSDADLVRTIAEKLHFRVDVLPVELQNNRHIRGCTVYGSAANELDNIAASHTIALRMKPTRPPGTLPEMGWRIDHGCPVAQIPSYSQHRSR